jgi:hypothetical protein
LIACAWIAASSAETGSSAISVTFLPTGPRRADKFYLPKTTSERILAR